MKRHWPIALIVAAFFALGVVYAMVTPLFLTSSSWPTGRACQCKTWPRHSL
jgi:hypothetical protein